MAQNWDEKAVFLAALGLAAKDRDAFLLGACPDEPARQRIRLLLDHHEKNATTGFNPEADSAPIGLADPNQIDEFRLIHKIGEGGMGVVYLAEDTILARRVALKIIGSHLLGSEQGVARFRDEARAAALLNHPAIVPVFKYGSDGTRHYIASEFVDGPTLSTVLEEERSRRQGMTRTDALGWFKRCAEIAATIADALDASHRMNIIHRDVKPSNILVDRHRGPRLTDFGVAKNLTVSPERPVTNIVGSCHYMSPEQASISAASVDQRSDIFSLGVVLYEMLTLQKPFVGADLSQVLRAVIEHNPPTVRSLDPRIPRDLQVICHKAIEKHPRDRYQSIAHLAADLRCYMAGDPILARPPDLTQRILRWLKRHKKAVVLICIAVLAFATLWMRHRLKLQHDLAMAWVSISAGSAPCKAYFQPHSLTTLEPLSDYTAIGPTPVQNLKLKAGQYRILVVRDSDRAFCEFNLVALEAGPDHLAFIRAFDSANEIKSPAERNELRGAFRHTRDIAQGEMIRIEGGDFELRTSNSQHPVLLGAVRLDSFLIDVTEVSNRDYRAFVDATGHPPPYSWTAFGYSPELEDRPVVWVSLADAEAYARWRGKRLPTLWEWQAAARGPKGDLYPTGAQLPDVPAPTLNQNLFGDQLALFQSYAEHTMSTRVPSAWDGVSGRLRHTFSNVCEFTGTVDLANRDVYLTGRGWYEDPRTRTLANVLTTPLKQPTPRFGFRCAKSILKN